MNVLINIQDDIIRLANAKVLDRLLVDKSTGKNIMWGTDAYSSFGKAFERREEIRPHLITGSNVGIIKTRARKAFEQQSARTKQHAEVFTPLWVCKKMIDHADEVWFGRAGAFDNTEENVVIPKKKKWQHYVDQRRLEITCGEAPFLVSRYDVASAEVIPIEKRIGILDRKLRIVNENTETEEEWVEWAFRAFESTYGYEFQGDNLLIARVNFMMSFAEYMEQRWHREPTEKEYQMIANRISWNLWQMDGLSGTIPYCQAEEEFAQFDMFGDMGIELDCPEQQPLCKIYDWRRENSLAYKNVNMGGRNMKFDFIIGNPPYQEEVSGSDENSSLAKQLFPSFVQEAIKCTSKGAVLITPSRWFAGDAQDKSFLKLREFLRENNHISRMVYYPNERDVFSHVTIKGGVCYFVYEMGYSGNVLFSTIENGIEHTMCRPLFEEGLDVVITDPVKISVLMKIQSLTEKYLTEMTKGRNAFGIIGKDSVVAEVSSRTPFPECCELRLKGDEIRYISKETVQKNIDVFNAWKIFISKSAGAPNTDKKVIGRAYVGKPLSACTDSLIPIGCFSTKYEAENLQKYMSTKFLRYMVSILKMSQNVTQIVYKYVPLQNFTPDSDIDWSKPIPEIDKQLYSKYGLSKEEIDFIETHVKEMS